MKKIINGKKYDTNTATEVCCGFFGNFGCKKVTLYKKKNGEFFEHHTLNEFGFSEWIEPVDKSEAKRFAEEQMTGDEYDKFFGEVEE